MILKASHHPFYYPFFQFYSWLKIKMHFHNVSVSHDFREKGLPILMISNHFSWWDGFWVVYLNLKLLHRKFFFFMMLEEELRKHRDHLEELVRERTVELRDLNLFSNTMPVEAMRRLFKVDPARDRIGNQPPLPAIFPRGEVPVVPLDASGARELVPMHWGFLMPQVSKRTGDRVIGGTINGTGAFRVKSYEPDRRLVLGGNIERLLQPILAQKGIKL